MSNWKQAFTVYKNPKMLVMLILGFFSALPFVLIFSTLSFWLSDQGVKVTAIALFSLVRLPYSFKFLWAPYIDRCAIPFLTRKLGRRRSWALLFQSCLIVSLFTLVHTNPVTNPLSTGLCALCVAFFSASQDIVFDAFRIEYLPEKDQGAAAATFVFGYRIGMLIAGAGALYLSDIARTLTGQNGWIIVYEIMALSGLFGIATVLCVKEPENISKKTKASFFKEAVIAPIKDFLSNSGWLLIILFLITYKLCETSIGTVTPKLYKELGFTNTQIATVVKLWGVMATVFGGFLGGLLVARLGIVRSLFICGVLQGLSNLPFAVLSLQGNSFLWLIISIVSDNMSAGMATTAFVAYMSSLCNTAYTATQYALLSSLMALPRDLLSSGSGWLVSVVGWPVFFVITAFLSLPGLIILHFLNRKYVQNQPIPSSANKP